MDELVKMLSEENKQLRKSGAELSIAALKVATEYDGVHRLMLAVSNWTKTMADEHGRGKMTSIADVFKKDHVGNIITKPEDPNDEITVWHIEPSGFSDFDVLVVRDYQQAVQAAQSVVEQLMDDPEIDHPLVIKIQTQKMTLYDYEEMIGDES